MTDLAKRTLAECFDFMDFACDADPYMSGLYHSLTVEQREEFRNHMAGMLNAFARKVREMSPLSVTDSTPVS